MTTTHSQLFRGQMPQGTPASESYIDFAPSGEMGIVGEMAAPRQWGPLDK
jgi:hypothetical protein